MQKNEKLPRSKVYVGICIGLGILLAVFALWYTVVRHEISIGKYSYSLYGLHSLQSQADSVGEKSSSAVRNKVVTALAYKAAADDIELKYPKKTDDISRAARELYPEIQNDDNPNKLQYLLAEADLIDTYVQMSQDSGMVLAVLEFPFSRYMTDFPSGNKAKSMDKAKTRDVNAIKDDIEYAKNSRDKYIKLLESKNADPYKLASEVSNNDRLFYGFGPNVSAVTPLLVVQKGAESYVTNIDSRDETYIFESQQSTAIRAKDNPNIAIVEDETIQGGCMSFELRMPEVEVNGKCRVGWVVTIAKEVIEHNPQTKTFNEKVKEYERGN